MTGEWKYHEYTIIYYYHIIIYYYILLYFHGGRCLFSLIFTTFQTPRGLGQGDILIGRRFDGTDYSCPPCMRGEWQEDGQRLFFICQFTTFIHADPWELIHIIYEIPEFTCRELLNGLNLKKGNSNHFLLKTFNRTHFVKRLCSRFKNNVCKGSLIKWKK